MTHICVSKLTIIGSDNGLSPGRRQAIIWTNAGILLIRTVGTNFSEILGEIHSFSFSKIHLKMSSAKWRLFGLGLNELKLGYRWAHPTEKNWCDSFIYESYDSYECTSARELTPEGERQQYQIPIKHQIGYAICLFVTGHYTKSSRPIALNILCAAWLRDASVIIRL